jgi:cysteine desulfurase
MGGAYLDHASAPLLDERVRAAMRPFSDRDIGSPDALHGWAQDPAAAIEEARSHVAALIGARPEEVIFTAGATESRNLAVKGLFGANRMLGDGLVASAVEHPAVLAACRTLQRQGGRLSLVGVDRHGLLAPGAVAGALDERTVVVSIHHGQGEVGAVQDVGTLVAAMRRARPEVRVHLDAGESAGLLGIDIAALDVDAVSIGGWPCGAPPWVGALIVREGARLHPLIEGGLQEHGKRAGAQNVPAIVGLGEAARIAREEMPARACRMEALGGRLIDGLLAVPGVRLNGPREGRLPGNVQVSTGDVEGESLALALAARGVACSPGSACTAHGGKAAPTLEAIGLEPPWTHSAVLFTLGHATDPAEIDLAIEAFADETRRLRVISPLTRR